MSHLLGGSFLTSHSLSSWGRPIICQSIVWLLRSDAEVNVCQMFRHAVQTCDRFWLCRRNARAAQFMTTSNLRKHQKTCVRCVASPLTYHPTCKQNRKMMQNNVDPSNGNTLLALTIAATACMFCPLPLCPAVPLQTEKRSKKQRSPLKVHLTLQLLAESIQLLQPQRDQSEHVWAGGLCVSYILKLLWRSTFRIVLRSFTSTKYCEMTSFQSHQPICEKYRQVG